MRGIRFIAFFAAVCVSWSAFAAVGSDPRKVEEIVIGGGVADSNGGLEIDKQGQLDSTGYLSGASVKLRQGSYRATISAPTLTGNRAITVPDAAGEVSLLGQGISTGEIDNGTILAEDLSANAVSGSTIQDGTIAAADLASDSVTTAKIAGLAVTTAKLAADSVTSAKITDGTIATADLADGSVTSDKISNGAVGTTKIAGDAVTSAKIADGTVAAADLASDSVTAAKIATDAVGASEIAADAVGASEIAGDAVGTSEIAADAVGASEIAADAVGASEIAAGAVGTSEISDGSIVNADISASAAIALSKLATGGGTDGQVMTLQSGVWGPAAAAGGSGNVIGPGPAVDNALARMDGTGGYTLQAYSSNTPTASDAGLVSLPGGLTVTGQVELGYGSDNSRPINIIASTSPSFALYRGSTSSANLRWVFGNSGGSESGTLTGNEFFVQVYDITGGYSHDALTINANPAIGARFEGTAGTKRDLYVDGVYYAANDLAITNAAGKLLLGALDTTGAAVGYVPSYNGSTVTWVAGSGNVSNAGSGTDNHFPRFNLAGTAIQDGQTVEDDSGNVDIAGTITAGSSNTQVTDSAGLVRDAALSSTVANLDQAETISGNWVNTANPWADNEVADGLTISGGTINNTVIGGATPAAGTFTTLTSTGDATIGDSSGTHVLAINGAAASLRDLRFQTAGSNRWVIRTESTAESGSNAGSALQILARDDSGNAIDNAVTIIRAAGGTVTLGSGRGIALSGQIASTLATGTAPLSVSSTTKVSNLNVDQVDGQDFASPGAIGGTSRGSALFTTIGANSTISLTGQSGNIAAPTASLNFGSYYDGTSPPSAGHISLYGNGAVGIGVSSSNTDQIVGSGNGFRVWGDPSATNPYASIQSTYADFDGYIKNGSSDIQLTNASGTIKGAALENSGVTAGTYNGLTVSAGGLITAASNLSVASSTTVAYWDDFLGNALEPQWSNVASGTGASGAFQDAVSGQYKIVSGTGTGSYDALKFGDYTGTVVRPFQRTKNAVVEVRLAASLLDSGDSIWLGFFYDDLPLQGALSNKKRACFSVNSGVFSDKWVCTTADGSATTNNATSTSPTGVQTLKIVLSSSNVKFYIDGSLMFTHTTNMPATTDNLYFCMQAYNSDAGTGSYLQPDYVSLSQDR